MRFTAPESSEQTEPGQARTQYLMACDDVVCAMMRPRYISEVSLEALVAAQDDDAAKKRLIVTLKCFWLISLDEAAFTIGCI